MRFLLLTFMVWEVFGLDPQKIRLAKHYFSYKGIKNVCYFSCEPLQYDIQVAKQMFVSKTKVSVFKIDKEVIGPIDTFLHHQYSSVGVMLDGDCDHSATVLEKASEQSVLDGVHSWLVFAPHKNYKLYIEDNFQMLNLSIDADVAVVGYNDESDYVISDVFNFGKIQGNGLEINHLGRWRTHEGLTMNRKGFKYYQRWDFHNLTLRAVSVMLHQPTEFRAELLSELGYTEGVLAMTKVTSQLLNLLKDHHNFRFRYTIVDRWIGSPDPNSTLAVSNSLYWRQQDISSTSARIFGPWPRWVDFAFPPTVTIQTKFFYLMLETGAGDYENRFLTPLSLGAWCCTLGASALCVAVLTATARLESRPRPGAYAFFTVSAALFQQGFEDGDQDKKWTSQGRKLTLLVVGLTSMLLYNYYTSSVVSWLLNAAAPSIASLDQLIDSNMELIFEDIGYTRGWIENPGFYYYSGYVNPAEDRLRQVKVTAARRTVPPLQTVAAGVQLMRTGMFAFHTEPYTARQAIAPSYSEEELCSLGALQMMPPARLYIMLQKKSPYKEFFVWSLIRLSERGHLQASQRRFPDDLPACSGRKPRALALGQAAPAALVLLQLSLLSFCILLAERTWHRYHPHSPPANLHNKKIKKNLRRAFE